MEACEHVEMLQDHRYPEVNKDEPKAAQRRVQIMRKVWNVGRILLFLRPGLDHRAIQHMGTKPKFSNVSNVSNLKDGANKILAPYWSSDA